VLLILCPLLHLAHFGLVSTSLRHVEAMCSSKRHNWQQLLVLAKKFILGLTLPSIPFPKKLMKVSFKTWSCPSVVDSPDVASSYSSFMGSYGVSPSSPNTRSISATTTTISSMSMLVVTTQSFLIFGFSFARNLRWCSASCIWPRWKSLSNLS